jgi:hypothetical protein
MFGAQVYDLKNLEYPYPNSLSFSLLKQYNNFKQLSNFIISNALFLYSQLYSEDLELIQFISKTDNYDDKIRKLINTFDTHIKMSEITSYNLNRNLSLYNTSIIKNESTLLVPNEKIKRKLSYILYINSKYNIKETISYKNRKYVNDYYTTSKDFESSEHYSIFFTYEELKFTKVSANNYNVISTINNILDDVFYFRNNSVINGELCILQKCENLENALYIANEWNNSKINRYRQGPGNQKLNLNPESINFIIYTYQGNDEYSEMSFVNNEAYNLVYVLINTFENVKEQFYYAVLPLDNINQLKIDAKQLIMDSESIIEFEEN